MRDMGEFEILGAPAGSEVAVRSNDSEWILGHVIQFRPDVGYYDIADADDDSKSYSLPETEVIVLDMEIVKKIR